MSDVSLKNRVKFHPYILIYISGCLSFKDFSKSPKCSKPIIYHLPVWQVQEKRFKWFPGTAEQFCDYRSVCVSVCVSVSVCVYADAYLLSVRVSACMVGDQARCRQSWPHFFDFVPCWIKFSSSWTNFAVPQTGQIFSCKGIVGSHKDQATICHMTGEENNI